MGAAAAACSGCWQGEGHKNLGPARLSRTPVPADGLVELPVSWVCALGVSGSVCLVRQSVGALSGGKERPLPAEMLTLPCCRERRNGPAGRRRVDLPVLLLATETLFVSVCRSFLQLGAGLSVGLSGLAAGFAIGIVGDAGVRGTAQQPRLFVGMILILIFAEVLGLYGLIVALILSTK